MSSKLCPKIILEGTRLTFKTDIALALNEHPRIVGPRKYRYHSPLISAEWCTFTNFPWGRGLINFEPQEEALALETYQTWARLFELQRYYSWIVDRFHISTQMYSASFVSLPINSPRGSAGQRLGRIAQRDSFVSPRNKPENSRGSDLRLSCWRR